MASFKVSIDFSDRPELVHVLRLLSTRTGRSQKDIVASALDAYFSREAENELPLFAEWNDPEDDVYDSL